VESTKFLNFMPLVTNLGALTPTTESRRVLVKQLDWVKSRADIRQNGNEKKKRRRGEKRKAVAGEHARLNWTQ